MSVIVPGRFGSPTKKARDHLSNQLALLTAPYLNSLGWDVVANDLLSIAAGLIATGSDKPAADLEKGSAFIRRYDWKRAKKMLFAAKQGIDPSQLGKEFLSDEIPGHNPVGADIQEGNEPKEAPGVSQDAGQDQ